MPLVALKMQVNIIVFGKMLKLTQTFNIMAASCARKGELFIMGGPACQQTCPNLLQPCLIATFAPVNDCYCRPTFARVTEGGECVPISMPECLNAIKPRTT